MIKFSRLI